MPGDHDDAVPRAGKFGDDIADRKFALGSFGDEGVVFHGDTFQVGGDVGFEFFVVRASDGTGAEGHHVADVLHGAPRGDRRVGRGVDHPGDADAQEVQADHGGGEQTHIQNIGGGGQNAGDDENHKNRIADVMPHPSWAYDAHHG